MLSLSDLFNLMLKQIIEERIAIFKCISNKSNNNKGSRIIRQVDSRYATKFTYYIIIISDYLNFF